MPEYGRTLVVDGKENFTPVHRMCYDLLQVHRLLTVADQLVFRLDDPIQKKNFIDTLREMQGFIADALESVG